MTSPLLAAAYAGNDTDGQYLGVLLIRVVIGLTLAAHGYFKFFKGGKIAGTARWFDSIGMKPNGKIHALMAATTEIGAGLLFAIGVLTPFAAAGFVGLMFVAAWTVNRPNGFFSANHGYEFNLTLATVAVGVAAIGPGKYSVDWQLDLEFPFDPKVAVGIAAGLGLVVACFRPPVPVPEEVPLSAEDQPHEVDDEAAMLELDDEPAPSSDDATLIIEDDPQPDDDRATLELVDDEVPVVDDEAGLDLVDDPPATAEDPRPPTDDA